MKIDEKNAIINLMVAYNTNFSMQNEAKIYDIKKEFLINFTVDVTKKPKYVLQLLKTAYYEKNASDVEYCLALMDLFNLVSNDYSLIFIKLLAVDWHTSHENIVNNLQKLKLPETIDCLYSTALKPLDYLEYDESFSLAVKCIWALGEINNQKAKEKLELLTKSSNKVIKNNALIQLENIRVDTM